MAHEFLYIPRANARAWSHSMYCYCAWILLGKKTRKFLKVHATLLSVTSVHVFHSTVTSLNRIWLVQFCIHICCVYVSSFWCCRLATHKISGLEWEKVMFSDRSCIILLWLQEPVKTVRCCKAFWRKYPITLTGNLHGFISLLRSRCSSY